jgi:hypothetical protein
VTATALPLRDRAKLALFRLAGPVPGRYWLLLAGIYLVCYVFWHAYQKPWTGDALYYTAMAFRYSGHDLHDAIRLTGEYFHEPNIERLNYGFTNPVIAPLIYPRVVYPGLSVPFVLLMGGTGMWVVPLLSSIFILWGMTRLLTRLFTAEIALTVMAVFILTTAFLEYLTGAFTEAPTVAFVVAILMMMPLGGRVFTTRDGIICSVLIVLVTFSRQAAPVVVAAIMTAWLWEALGRRSLRGNPWTKPVLWLLPVGVVASLIQRWWAPYDVVAWFVRVNHEPSTRSAFSHFPEIAWHLMVKDATTYFGHDLGMLAIWSLGLLAIFIRPLSVRTGLLLGGLIPSIVLATLNSLPSSFRFFLPMYPFLILSAAGLLHFILVRPRAVDGGPVPGPGTPRGTDWRAGSDQQALTAG